MILEPMCVWAGKTNLTTVLQLYCMVSETSGGKNNTKLFHTNSICRNDCLSGVTHSHKCSTAGSQRDAVHKCEFSLFWVASSLTHWLSSGLWPTHNIAYKGEVNRAQPDDAGPEATQAKINKLQHKETPFQVLHKVSSSTALKLLLCSVHHLLRNHFIKECN